MSNPKNKTGKKSLDRIAKDPRIKEITIEDGCSDYHDVYNGAGFVKTIYYDKKYCVTLDWGFNAEGCRTLMAYTVKELIASMALVTEGEPN